MPLPQDEGRASGAKARLNFEAFSARLKSCPFKTHVFRIVALCRRWIGGAADFLRPCLSSFALSCGSRALSKLTCFEFWPFAGDGLVGGGGVVGVARGVRGGPVPLLGAKAQVNIAAFSARLKSCPSKTHVFRILAFCRRWIGGGRLSGSGTGSSRGSRASGAKARVDFEAFSARLKSCPFKTPMRRILVLCRRWIGGGRRTSFALSGEVVPFQNLRASHFGSFAGDGLAGGGGGRGFPQLIRCYNRKGRWRL